MTPDPTAPEPTSTDDLERLLETIAGPAATAALEVLVRELSDPDALAALLAEVTHTATALAEVLEAEGS